MNNVNPNFKIQN